MNGYESEFSHDVVGILTNLFTQGEFGDAHALLTEARNVVGSQAQYVDGLWTYAVPWAVYLMKTGDIAFVEQNFATSGPAGPAAQPSIEASAHAIAADRTGPSGTMEATNDIDTQGLWTVDDFEALLGLAAYRYIAATIGNATEANWAGEQYLSLLQATDAVLGETIATNHLDYLPCSLTQPNTANRCNNPKDANWTSPFGFGGWAWEAGLLGGSVTGPGATLIDATYDYGFGAPRRASSRRTPPVASRATTTRAATTRPWVRPAWPARSHRDQGILDFEFMVAHGQSGPWSWWESSSAPDPRTPWVGSHPASGQGSSPHAWGIAGSDKVLLDSIVAQRADGVGRRRPRRPAAVAEQRHTDCGHQLPHHGRQAVELHHRRPRHRRHPDPRGCDPARQDPLRAPLVRPQRRGDIGRRHRSGQRHRHPRSRRPPRHGHVAPRTVSRPSTARLGSLPPAAKSTSFPTG